MSADAPVVVSEESDNISVTIYRDPNRQEGAMNLRYLQGFALISETRTITLPAGQSTIRFEGVAEGMVAVSAIVTGLPGGVVQKNRDKKLLSPASLIDGTLGNRVDIRRTNPATGEVTETEAIIRTGANGGVVLQTAEGVEALRCAGLPETLIYDKVPAGLSAKPVLSVDTEAPEATTVTVTLTYLAAGFDWNAHYVGHLSEDASEMRLMSWLTLANQNAERFENAEVLAVAGTLNIVRPATQLADRPDAPQLRLTCYPQGSTATGTPYSTPARPEREEMSIVVSGARRNQAMMASPAPVSAVSDDAIAQLEQLGDLKLYRVPFRSTIGANAQKQVALLVKNEVPVEYVYTGYSSNRTTETLPTKIEFRMKNTEKRGLGLPLPAGGLTLFSPAAGQQLLLGETDIQDYAVGEDVEFSLATSPQVRFTNTVKNIDGVTDWKTRTIEITNANGKPVQAEITLGPVLSTDYRKARGGKIIKKKGAYVWSVKVPAAGKAKLVVQIRSKS